MMTASTIHGSLLAHDPSARALWEKLRGLSFDRGSGPNTFAARLAREQGWSAAFTGRVIEEYRRFLLLFALEQRLEKETPAASGNTSAVRIVPSAAVDKAWHLHLLYTRSYWGTLCEDILGQPLHHQPADGSVGEAAVLGEVYRVNMKAYRTTFGELAPGDIWPAPRGTPPPGMPLAEVLEQTDSSPGSNRVGRYLVFAAILATVTIFALLSSRISLDSDELAGALVMTGGIVIAIGSCLGLFLLLVRGTREPGRRRSVDARGESIFFCSSGSDGSSGSSGCDAHSHSSHGGHGDSGGGHSCGGHSCGGHGCGGH